MQVATGWKIAGFAALGLGAAATLAACTSRGGGAGATDGPMADLTKDLIGRLVPGSRGPLDVATQAIHEARGEDGRIRGVYDGTRLLTAADAHAYGTPAILDAARDIKGDGRASFNEIRHVARHFDADGDLVWSAQEARAFEAEVGIRWIPSA